MRRSLLAILAIAMAFPVCAEEKAVPIEYPMRKIPVTDPRFSEVLREVNQTLNKAPRGYVTCLVIEESLGAGKYLAHEEKNGKQYDTIIVQFSDHELKAGATIDAQLKTAGSHYEYENKAGEKQSARSYTIVSIVSGMSPEEFVENLAKGKVYTIIKGTKQIHCENCNGFGKVPDVANVSHSSDRKIACPLCHGKGEWTVPQSVLIKW